MLKKFGDLTLREIAQSPSDDIKCVKSCPFIMANCRQICAEMGSCLVDKIKEFDNYLGVEIEVPGDEQKND